MAAIFFIMHPSSVPGKHPQLYFKKERRSARKMKLCPLVWQRLNAPDVDCCLLFIFIAINTIFFCLREEESLKNCYMVLFLKVTRILREDVTIRQERKRDRKKKKRRRPEVGDCPLSVVVGLGRTCSKNGRILRILSKNYITFFHPKLYIYDLNNM